MSRAEQLQYLKEHPRSKLKPKAASSRGQRSLNDRVFSGKPVPLKNPPSKSETGKIGEKIALEWLRKNGMKDAHHLNTKLSNFPVDMIGDHQLIEVKTGIVSSTMQKWRATIGEPGEQEKAWLKTISPEEKKAWNKKKYAAIMARKNKMVAEYSKKLGKKIKGKTLTLIVNTDTRTYDLFMFDGFHHIITWKSEQAKQGYVGTFKYEGD